MYSVTFSTLFHMITWKVLKFALCHKNIDPLVDLLMGMEKRW